MSAACLRCFCCTDLPHVQLKDAATLRILGLPRKVCSNVGSDCSLENFASRKGSFTVRPIVAVGWSFQRAASDEKVNDEWRPCASARGGL